MVCSAQKVKVAVKSAKIGASSHVTNSILKNAAKWLVYASTVTYVYLHYIAPVPPFCTLVPWLMFVECDCRGILRACV